MKESTARIGDGRTLMTGLEVNAFRAVGRKSIIIIMFLSNHISHPHNFIIGD